MTSIELKNKIIESANPDWFNSVSESFNFPYINYNQELTGISAIFEYLNQQENGWSKIENLPPELLSCKTHIEEAKKAIVKFVSTYYNKINPDNGWRSNVKPILSNLSQQKYLPYYIPEVEFLIKVNIETPQYFKGAYNSILGNPFTINTKELFFGATLAYEFSFKDSTKITERINAEKSSISKIRNDFQDYFTESEKQILEHFKKNDSYFAESVSKIEELKTEKEKSFDTWFESAKNEEWKNWFDNTKNEEWRNWFIPTSKKIAELEETYKEKLKLEEPAKYWNERAEQLKKQGWMALGIIVILVIITCWSLAEILWTAPSQIYESWFGEDKSAAIRWSIIYITLISFIAFCIRALTKVMFSSFHLARDCEERYTLTYFYLSLHKDNKVDEKDRQLIMQSLFSRAETGLLKDDSSPTMPNDAISKIISK